MKIHRYPDYFEKKNLHVKLTLLTKLINSSYKLALLIHHGMCLVQRQLKQFSMHWAVERMAQDSHKTAKSKYIPS